MVTSIKNKMLIQERKNSGAARLKVLSANTAEQLAEARERYCKRCQLEIGDGHCYHFLLPLTITGEPCPYFQPRKG